MYTIELLEEAITLVARLGYIVRQEPLAGNGGGCCELKGRKLFFLDLDLGPEEQFEQVLEALRGEPDAPSSSMSPELRDLVKQRRMA